ncbi:hypothetical protein FJTKL_11071 [Diaporthe vaccinii]|uniref:Uncharacterized protein n=1 Tax=Diaporthe vaccinii TaxID=105482 RepID=A0ABR4EIQ8_9PEZI
MHHPAPPASHTPLFFFIIKSCLSPFFCTTLQTHTTNSNTNNKKQTTKSGQPTKPPWLLAHLQQPTTTSTTTSTTTTTMSPTYTMSAHLCKQIAASWKEIRHPLEPGQVSPTAGAHFPSSFQRASSPTGSDSGKRSMDIGNGAHDKLEPALRLLLIESFLSSKRGRSGVWTATALHQTHADTTPTLPLTHTHIQPTHIHTSRHPIRLSTLPGVFLSSNPDDQANHCNLTKPITRIKQYDAPARSAPSQYSPYMSSFPPSVPVLPACLPTRRGAGRRTKDDTSKITPSRLTPTAGRWIHCQNWPNASFPSHTWGLGRLY